MNLSTKPNWTRVEIQARIDPPQTPLNKEVTKNAKECNIIKINMRRDPASAMSKTYKLKLAQLENRKPEELLRSMKNPKNTIYGTGTTFAFGRIRYIRTMLRG